MVKNILILFLLTAFLPAQAQQNTIPVAGPNLEGIAYPFEVNYISLNLQGENLKMAYMDVQPQKPNEKTVLLLPGKNFNGAYWEQTARDLAAGGYRVIIPDQIGFGKSSKPERIQYSFQLLARNTKTLLDSLGIAQVNVLGHSMGGMLATRFALMYPAVATKLILENPIGLEDWKIHVPYQTVEDWYKQELAQTYEKMKAYQLKFYYGNEWKPAYDKWLNLAAAVLSSVDYPRIAWNSALLYDMIFTQPVCYEFENLDLPVLLIIGQRDRTALGKDKAPKAIQESLGNYPVLGKATAQKIKGAQLIELDNTGHLPHIENYEGFIQPLKNFLAQP